MKRNINNFIVLLTLPLLLALSAGNALANVAANARIINNATLSYNDGTGTRTATASVTVTVALVPAIPIVTPGPPQTTSYGGSSTLQTNSFTVTATANGPDTYGITSAITASTNTTSPSVTPQSSTLFLGATVTVSGSSASSIVVPSDGTSDNFVNGIQAGSTVVIGAETRTVQSVVDNASGTSIINLTSALSSAPSAGVVVAEQKTVLVNVTAGNIGTPGTNITVTKNITVTSTTNSGITVTSGTVTDTYTSGTATLVKYVRNVTTPAAGTGVYSYNSTNYYSSGITAKPGETLEYILVATNSGTGPVTSAVVTDSLPTTYVALKTGVYSSGTRDITYINESGIASYLTQGGGDDQATYASPTLTVYVGTGASSSSGGSIAAGATVRVLYQVTVNP